MLQDVGAPKMLFQLRCCLVPECVRTSRIGNLGRAQRRRPPVLFRGRW